MGMAKNKEIQSIEGITVKIQADTLCVHGDNPHAIAFAKKIKRLLTS